MSHAATCPRTGAATCARSRDRLASSLQGGQGEACLVWLRGHGAFRAFARPTQLRSSRIVFRLRLALLLLHRLLLHRRTLRNRWSALLLSLQGVRQLVVFGCELPPALRALGCRIVGRPAAAPLRFY